MKFISALFCMALMAGCSSVTLKEPFPDSELTSEEQESLTGIWHLYDSVMHVEFNGNDIPWAATVEWKGEDFVLAKFRIHIAKRNDTLYACMPAEPGSTNQYLFAEIKPTGEAIIIWGPDAHYFSKQVKNGMLKGSVDEGKHTVDVVLDTPASDILALISTNPSAIRYKEPLYYQRLK